MVGSAVKHKVLIKCSGVGQIYGMMGCQTLGTDKVQ